MEGEPENLFGKVENTNESSIANDENYQEGLHRVLPGRQISIFGRQICMKP